MFSEILEGFEISEKGQDLIKNIIDNIDYEISIINLLNS